MTNFWQTVVKKRQQICTVFLLVLEGWYAGGTPKYLGDNEMGEVYLARPFRNGRDLVRTFRRREVEGKNQECAPLTNRASSVSPSSYS